MINICLVSDLSTGTQLALKIVDLEYPEKEYQEIKIGIKNKKLINIPILKSNKSKSDVIIIDNLTPETVYEIVAKVKYNDEWQDVQQCAFITQVKRPNYYGNNKPFERFRGGAL
jgi:hypothetical protein